MLLLSLQPVHKMMSYVFIWPFVSPAGHFSPLPFHTFPIMPADSKNAKHTLINHKCLCAEVTPSPLQSAAGCRAFQLGGGNREVTMVQKEQTGSPASQETVYQTRSRQDSLGLGKINWKME